MKSNTLLRPHVAGRMFLAVLALHCGAAFAQVAGGGQSAGGVTPSMTKFFGSNTNFIAKTEVRVLDKQQHEITSMNMGFEMLGGRSRMDINMAEVKSKEMSPEFAGTMKQMGMDQMITIQLPDKKSILTIYPGLKSYAESPMAKDEIEGATKAFKIDKTRLAKETVDGHPCEKNDMTFTDDKGTKQHVILWNATDLKDFPVQLQMSEDDSTLVMKFKDVKLGRPENSHFDAPSTYTRYDNVKALLSDAVAKRTNLATPK